MDFREQFERWLKDAFRAPVPPEVQAYSFNLYEPANEKDVKFGVEVVGARRFDPEDSQWATDEIWAPKIRRLNIPQSFSGDEGQDCLAKLRTLLSDALEKGDAASAFLKARRGVGLGFREGDREILWSDPQPPANGRTTMKMRRR
ncbi:MAG: hypothetical protein QM765_52640 [Myxococcales bacterium]